MRVLVLGVGSVGEVIARHVSEDERISLSLADVDEARLQQVKQVIRSRKVRCVKIDDLGDEAFDEVLKQSDILVNAANPSINLELMKLCQRHRVNYMDLASDDIDQQLSLASGWRRRDMLGLICMGEDPGLSNIYARYASRNMDRVYEIRVRDGEFSIGRRYPIAALYSPEVFLKEIQSPSCLYLDGRYMKLPAFGGREVYEFPQPIGRLTVYSVNHEEVYTLPKYIGRGVRYVDFKLALSDELVYAVKLLKRLGLMRANKLRVGDALVAPRDLLLALLPRPYEVSKHIKGYAVLVVKVMGERKGKTIAYTMYTLMRHEDAYRAFGVNATAYLTGTVPASVLSLFVRGHIEERGVLVPEQLDPEPIMKMTAKKDIIHRLVLEQDTRIRYDG